MSRKACGLEVLTKQIDTLFDEGNLVHFDRLPSCNKNETRKRYKIKHVLEGIGYYDFINTRTARKRSLIDTAYTVLRIASAKLTFRGCSNNRTRFAIDRTPQLTKLTRELIYKLYHGKPLELKNRHVREYECINVLSGIGIIKKQKACLYTFSDPFMQVIQMAQDMMEQEPVQHTLPLLFDELPREELIAFE